MSKVIAHLIETDGPGGAERMLASLANELQASGYPGIAFVPARVEGWLESELRGFGVPIEYVPLHKPFSRTGGIGRRYARGTINGAALINMVESGAFDEAPRLQMVITTLAFGALMLVAGFGNGQNIRSDAPALVRRHVIPAVSPQTTSPAR